MNILITGSHGFIGSHLKVFMGQEYHLLCPTHRELDLTDCKAVDTFFNTHHIDFIIHAAACGVRIRADASLRDVAIPNLEMYRNLAKHASAQCPMIVIGSGAEYDKSKPLTKVKETDFGKTVPQDAYGYSKYIISKDIEQRQHILNLRVFGIYGARENSTRVTTSIISDCIEGRPICLRQNVVFQFIYIDDLCQIIIHFVRNFPDIKFINTVPDKCISIRELAEIANEISGKHLDIKFEREGYQMEYTADNSRLKSLIPNLTFTECKTGMRLLYAHLQKERG